MQKTKPSNYRIQRSLEGSTSVNDAKDLKGESIEGKSKASPHWPSLHRNIFKLGISATIWQYILIAQTI